MRYYFRGIAKIRSCHRRRPVKKGALKNFAIFTGKHLCWSLFLIELKVFSYEYYEIFQNIYFAENLHMGASERAAKNLLYLIFTSPYKSWTFKELVMGKYKSKVNDSDI